MKVTFVGAMAIAGVVALAILLVYILKNRTRPEPEQGGHR